MPLRKLKTQYLQGSVLKLKLGTKLVTLYLSTDLQTKIKIFELNLENLVQMSPLLVVEIGEFYANLINWFCQDKTSFEDDATENLTSQFGLQIASGN